MTLLDLEFAELGQDDHKQILNWPEEFTGCSPTDLLGVDKCQLDITSKLSKM
jgi:hypothetical protein